MKKYNLGSVHSIFGKPEEITPLFLSLVNWGGIDITANLLDLGAPEIFVYFLISEERFLKARTHCWVCQISTPAHKYKERGNWAEAQAIARREWENIESEYFDFGNHDFAPDYSFAPEYLAAPQ